MKTRTLQSLPDTTTLQDAVDQLHRCVAQLNDSMFERKAEVFILFLGLIARKNVCYLGDPGVGKSMLVELFSSMINRRYWAKLMMKSTTAEEMFGMYDIRELKQNGNYIRKLGSGICSAEVAFIDEIWKGSSSILNSLLTIANERKFDNCDGGRIDVPVEMIVSASNEMPKLEGDESCAALWDRFVIRRWVDDVKSRDNLLELIDDCDGDVEITEFITREQVDVLRHARKAVDLSGVKELLCDVKDRLDREHGIRVSTRKLKQAAQIIKAAAIMDGRLVAQNSDLLCLEHVLWEKPEEAAHVRAVVSELCGGDLADAQADRDAALEAWERGVETGNDSNPRHMNYDEARRGQKSDGSKPRAGESTMALTALNEILKGIVAKMQAYNQDEHVVLKVEVPDH